MSHPSFAVSGYGRSGTRWLAELLNRSPTFTVRHEPHNECDFHAIDRRFREETAKGPYGEVNSFCRFVLRELPVDFRALIVRDPLEILVSYANRNPHEIRCYQQGGNEMLIEGTFLDELVSSLAVIDLHARAGVQLFSFDEMTTNPLYLHGIVSLCGVPDVEPTQADVETKVNSAGRAALPDWLALGSEDLDGGRARRSRIERRLRWFRERYAHLGAKTTRDPWAP